MPSFLKALQRNVKAIVLTFDRRMVLLKSLCEKISIKPKICDKKLFAPASVKNKAIMHPKMDY
jgi:hypothetical protein